MIAFLKRSLNLQSLSMGVLAILFCTSCEKDHMLDCLKGTGNNEIEFRSVPAFKRVYIYDNVEAEIYPGHEFKIEITAGGKLIEAITTEVEDSTLRIRNENKCNWVRSFKNEFKVKVWLPEITELNANGSGNVTLMDTIRTKEFVYNSWSTTGDILLLFNTESAHPNIHTGSANITMRGYVGVLYLYNNGIGVVDARDCEGDVIFTENAGTNDQFVYSNGALFAKISYTGNVYYRGKLHELEREGSGSGQLLKLE